MTRSNSRLSTLLERIEDIESRRKELLDERAQYLAEAKALGYQPKIIRAMLQRRKREREEVLADDLLLRNYEVEVGMEVLD